jgi:Holliday junction DNA helicase RuvA
MIVRITGMLVDVTESGAILDRDGLAYEVLTPQFAIGELAAWRGRDVTLHTMEFYEGNQSSGHLVPRLVGFLHPEDKLFFHRFLEVRGIGIRKALRALSEPVRRVASWIEQGDTKQLAKLSGIGKRGAELIVATLKGKLEDLALPPEGAPAGGPAGGDGLVLSQAQRDAMEVLVAWGDPRADVQRWLERAAQLHPDVEEAGEWVRAAYKVKTGAER